MKDGRRAELPCPVCGGRSYRRGQLRTQGIHFIADDAPFWRKLFGFGWKLPARRCDDCGNIQLFSRPPRDAKTKRRRDGDFE
jgi:hypothetical protein